MPTTLPAHNSKGYGVLIVGLALGISGCATTRDCDPHRDPGFFGSVNCHASSAYTKRTDEMKVNLNAVQAHKDQLIRELDGIKKQQEENDRLILAAGLEHDRMEQQVHDLQAEERRIKQASGSLSGKVRAIQGKIAMLQQQAKQARAKVSELHRLKEKLEREKRKKEDLLLED